MDFREKPSLDELYHYGVKRRSGRYPWGSGEDPYQHSGDFLSRVDELRKSNFKYTDKDGKTWTGDNAIAKSMGLTSTQFRTQLSLANDERRALDVATAKDLKAKGYSTTEIGRQMGKNESSIRSLLNEGSEARMNQAKATAERIKKAIEEKGMIDVGSGVEATLGISKEKLNQALYILELEGYPVYGGGVPQVTNPGKQTNLKVICPPGTKHSEIFNYENIHSLDDYISYDGGDSFRKAFEYPSSMDSKRLKIRYGDEGGVDKDGVIEIRRGVEDLSLGNAHYAQVRIMVDNDRYLKGMAVYSDDMPDGIDVIFNTNKKSGTPMRDVLKKIKDDPDNPFGSLIKEHGGQSYYDDPNGKYTDPITGKKQSLSLINKRAEEGDWGEWANKLPSQFLAKQNLSLIKKQLDLASADKQAEFDIINSSTNPTVKKVLLKSFADDCDSAAVHLKAAALPRQMYQVILPIESMKDNEVYAPNYKDGETVALIRYPHGGTFEIPILKVNNKQADARKILGNTPKDAIGINSKVAERLSGADFDGDTVMVIPCNSSRSKIKITSTPKLKDLEGFDNKLEYGADEVKVDKNGTEHYYRNGREYKIMKNTQTEMGKISNLITDMTLKGANESELAKAVKHSMVVIDAEKHKLDYKKSEVDNDIQTLKKIYQKHEDDDGYGGASTLLSRAKSEVSVPKRKGSPKIDPETGKQYYDTADDLEYTVKKVNKKTGEVTEVKKQRTQRSIKMAETDDAFTLVSDFNTPQERYYATYANKMKALANEARKTMLSTGKIKYDSSAKETYKNEVTSLEDKLLLAKKNKPRERQAQTIANAAIAAKQKDNPDMTKGELKKVKQQELSKARAKVGAVRSTIDITDKEWEAIQAGAISENKLLEILNNSDIDVIKQKAIPRATTVLSTAKINKANAMKASGYTTAEIAESLGVSASTVSKYLK